MHVHGCQGYVGMCSHGPDTHPCMHLLRIPSPGAHRYATRKEWHTANFDLVKIQIKPLNGLPQSQQEQPWVQELHD